MESEIKELKYDSFSAIEIKNKFLSLITIPELGGKIVSLKNIKSDFDFAFKNKTVELSREAYDSDYSKSSSAGIDECFMSISPSIYTEYPWKNTYIPDHGEIWSLKFKTEIIDEDICQKVIGVRFPYIFNRKIKLEQNKVFFFYKAENLSAMDLKFIWSFHPHFNLYEDTIIKIKDNPDMYIDYSKNNIFLSQEEKHIWPYAFTKNGKKLDFSSIEKINGDAEKLFISNFSKGKVSLIYCSQKEQIDFTFDNEKIKYCGLWINKNGWPDKNPYKTIAIEPCNCVTDKLENSIKRNALDIIPAEGSFEWTICLEIKNIKKC